LMRPMSLYENCRLCPRLCLVDRRYERGPEQLGICGESDRLGIAYVGPHFGEEPPITGTNGSGTVFFSGCSLRCAYCQNRQISHDHLGRIMDLESLLMRVEEMIQSRQVHNINFVTPDHFFPHVFRLVSSMRERGHELPFVYNLSGYQLVEMIRMAGNYADIYLPDFKYADGSLAARLSKCRAYPSVALAALTEMVRQKGFLNSCETGATVATKGVLVRHLILPGAVPNSINALTTLFIEFGAGLPLSLMSQYEPLGEDLKGALGRRLGDEEFERVYSHARDLGFRHLFVQFPDARNGAPVSPRSPFLPDFKKALPFGRQAP
jgi:putative pyruvate formate lyase activating enzyme